MKVASVLKTALFSALLSLVVAPAFADTSEKADTKAAQETSQVQREFDKEELKKAWAADKRAREEAQAAGKDAKEQKHESLGDVK